MKHLVILKYTNGVFNMKSRLTLEEYWHLPIHPKNKLTIESLQVDVYCTYNQEEDRLYVYYEQSIEGMDWILNIFAWSSDLKLSQGSIKVHNGFKTVSMVTLPHIELLLLKYNCANITITGYSHGGAPAAISHIYLKDKFPNLNIDTCIFGAARFLIKDEKNPEYRRVLELTSDIIRVQYGEDIVTHLPCLLSNYTDCGILYKVGHSTTLIHELLTFLTFRPFKSDHAGYRFRLYGRLNYQGDRYGTIYL